MTEPTTANLARFETLVRDHQDMVYSTAMRITGDPHESQDIAQKVFIQALGRFEDLQRHENPAGWLCLTARNLSINYVKRHTWRIVPFGDHPEPVQPETEERDWLFGNDEQLKQALDCLSRPQRAVIALHYYEDQSYEQAASALGCSVAKVKTDLFRARARLKVELEKLQRHP